MIMMVVVTMRWVSCKNKSLFRNNNDGHNNKNNSNGNDNGNVDYTNYDHNNMRANNTMTATNTSSNYDNDALPAA
jgi:hypothetical protein